MNYKNKDDSRKEERWHHDQRSEGNVLTDTWELSMR